MNERKFLNPSSGFDFTRVQISVGILNDVMHVVKLAGIAARVAECSNDSAVAPMNDPDYVVFSIGHEQILLAFVARESEVIRGAHADRFFAHEDFLYKLSFLRKRLNSVVHPIANVNKSIA